MHRKLDVRDGSTGVVQPQLVNDPVNQRKHETDQEYVGMGDELTMVLRGRHVDSQCNADGGITQRPYQKSSIQAHACLHSLFQTRSRDDRAYVVPIVE